MDGANGMRLAINHRGFFVNGVGDSTLYGPDCKYWRDASDWSEGTGQRLSNSVLESMDALRGSSSTISNLVQVPLVSYQLGQEDGWMPMDPRQALCKCQPRGDVGAVRRDISGIAGRRGGCGNDRAVGDCELGVAADVNHKRPCGVRDSAAAVYGYKHAVDAATAIVQREGDGKCWELMI